MKKVLVCLISILTAIGAWGAVYTSGSTTVTVSGNTITVSGNGAMEDYASSAGINSLWGTYRSSSTVTNIVVEEGVTHIGSYAFSNFSYITSVSIPSTVKTIGDHAFYYSSNTKIAQIHASTPNDWASIELQGDYPQYTHPFGKSNASSRNFYFNGSNSAATTLAFEAGLTEIKPYAFYGATGFSYINIPGTVETIGASAFQNCTIGYHIVVNRSEAPSLGSNAIPAVSKTLYVPTTNSGYTSGLWSNYTLTPKDVSGTMSAAQGANVTWSLTEEGVLTLNATGENKTITFTSYNYPWEYFRRLVNKVVLKGNITELTKTFTYCFGLAEIEFDQIVIPTITIESEDKIAFNSRFDQSKNVILKIKPASLTDASVTNLEADPWDNAKLDIMLSEDVAISDNVDNTTLLANINTYVEKPFTMNLTRSLSNAYYNTFCSPIDMDASLVESTFGAGTLIHAMTDATVEGETFTLNFGESQPNITAGVPYLLQPANNVSNPSFTNVNPSDVATAEGVTTSEYVDFHGTLKPTAVTPEQADAKSFIILLANNELSWANASGNNYLKGMRAYWLIKDGSQAAASKRPVIRISGEEQGIGEVRSETANAVRSEKIMRNGQIYIVRDGQEYTILGQKK